MTMNHLTVFLSIAIFTVVLVFHGDAFAQTTPYPPQQPTKNAPTTRAPAKTQTIKTEPRTSQSQFHQAKKEHGHGYSHGGGGVGVGVGATIDLGGIGQRRPEADPFAVPAGSQTVAARTQEKPKAPGKKPQEVATPDPFSRVELTGAQAKAGTAPPLSGKLSSDPWFQINPVSKDLSQTEQKEPPPAQQYPKPSP